MQRVADISGFARCGSPCGYGAGQVYGLRDYYTVQSIKNTE